MTGGSNITDRASFKNSYTLSEKISQLDQAHDDIVKMANRRLVWIVGGLMSALPWAVSGMVIFFYQESNPSFAALYREFQSSFVNGGSFLWLSITVLAMALVELLQNGFRKERYQRTLSGHDWFLVFAVIFIAIVFTLYFFNIGNPMKESYFTLISIVTFVLFGLLSWFILFKVTK